MPPIRAELAHMDCEEGGSELVAYVDLQGLPSEMRAFDAVGIDQADGLVVISRGFEGEHVDACGVFAIVWSPAGSDTWFRWSEPLGVTRDRSDAIRMFADILAERS